MRASRRSLAPIATLAVALAFCIPCYAETPTPTVTSLTLSSASVATGITVTLTAHVTASGAAVHPGTVTFCNASATHCEDASILGTAQLTTTGTAKLPLRLGAGTYSIKAIFHATPNSPTPRAASTSTAQTLTVHGIDKSSTSTVVANKVGNFYQLSSTVSAFGRPTLTGTVSFEDTVNNGTPMTLGSASLSSGPAQIGVGLPISTTLSIASFLNDVVSGDFNNDGIPDVAGIYSFDGISGPLNPALVVLLGNGDGTFTTKTPPIPGNFPRLVAVGDFDNDGKLDLITNEDAVFFLHGNGDGTFTVGQPQPALGLDAPVWVADLNGDGILDLASGFGENPVTSPEIMLGNGDGTFNMLPLSSGSSFTPLALGDFNGDGIPDLAGLDLNSNLMTLLGKGDGTFTMGPTSPTPLSSPAISVGDFNGNGISDLFALDSSGNATIFLGKGDGAFTLKSTTILPKPLLLLTSLPSVLLADFNNDGKLDTVFVSNLGTLIIVPGNGDGTLGPAFSSGTGNPNLVFFTVADFNGDGIPDVATSGPQDATFPVVDVLLGAPTKAISIANIHLQSDLAHSIVASYSGSSAYSPSVSSVAGIITFPDVTSRLRITSTGFVYSRVTKTFSGTVTVTNISNSAIPGPLQIGFSNLPVGVTLVNATSTIGTAFIAIPGGLAAKQTTSFSVHFSNPSNLNISYTPVAYTGAF